MADETNRDSDILSQLQGLTQSNNQTDATLKSIDASLKSIMLNVNNISMSDARSRNEKSPFKNTPYRNGSSGRSGSPFSTKNLPKSDVEMPTAEIERYKAVVAEVQKDDLLIIHRITADFLSNILEKKYKKLDKAFSYTTDMKKMMMSRLSKEYIYTKGMWNEYLDFLQKKIDIFYKDKKGR